MRPARRTAAANICPVCTRHRNMNQQMCQHRLFCLLCQLLRTAKKRASRVASCVRLQRLQAKCWLSRWQVWSIWSVLESANGPVLFPTHRLTTLQRITPHCVASFGLNRGLNCLSLCCCRFAVRYTVLHLRCIAAHHTSSNTFSVCIAFCGQWRGTAFLGCPGHLKS